jgi:UDP-glucose 4-epimerase
MPFGKVLITGGAGLIGSHLADLLSQQSAREIVILDNFMRGRMENLRWAQQHGTVRVVPGDIRDRQLLAELMPGVEVVFHQAALRLTQCAEQPRLALEILADGTFNVLEAAVAARVKKVVAASSASVYGLADVFPTPESQHPYHNRTLYGAAKTFNEGLLRSFYEMYGLDYVALRYFNVYGPRMDSQGAHTEVLVRWIERLAAGQAPIINGDGCQTMDFLFAEDAALANVLAAEAPVTDKVFNVAGGVETSLNDLAQTLLRVMGSDLQPTYGPERRVNPVARRLADTRQARERLGFNARVGLEEGLRRLVQWWRAEAALAAA